ncbi:5-formyltetrahydrofolate cyclo-ligase [Spiroplasma sp. NBRC 100390]|uniref:5-formyltetrahydrofolate cyclo-ligase n=1 Tax=unclassified Spiroplasma TaxID=2637901 RepID=UPI00089287EE|nr:MULTISPECIES: 5-formyltetrahydrofolate cyclo-ligase [unclassified Spiroplasma]AOX44317.1 5-formyltetrahydrofolate cyclo-ligase [Spiroplasma sp. TU-14]APE13787.1 5-formyltetrahydrofolate cyclo-ligase [Spiroplasma sp. NBRC 100390]
MVVADKQQIRREKLIVRQNITSSLRYQKEQQIFECFFNNHIIQKSKNIAIYYSIKGEVDTILIMQKLLAAKTNVFLPRLVGDDLQFYQITNLTTDLEFNQRYGLYEPRSTLTLIEKDKIDVIVVPIVAFDQNNFRLGYGKGYYDRFLKNYHKMAIGLAFIEQLVTTPLPIEKHDIKIKTIISA